MTKTEFEEFRKEFRELRDMTVRLDTKMDGVAAQLTEGVKRFDDHEHRLRRAEDVLSQFKGGKVIIALVLSGLSIIVTGVGVALRLVFKI
jgi:hypothetical protein